ncbi:MAG: chromate transporter [Acidobacteriota bacterium]
MNVFVVYLLLLKAVLTSFSGLGSLPMIREDFVVERHALTDHQMNTAVVAGRTGPGPYGLYVVCVGYLAAGIPGAIAGFIALITPAFLVIPLMRWLGRRAEIPRVKSAIRGLLLAAAGLLLSAAVPLTADALAQTALARPYSLVILVLSFGLLTFTKIDSAWLMGGAALVGLGTLLI